MGGPNVGLGVSDAVGKGLMSVEVGGGGVCTEIKSCPPEGYTYELVRIEDSRAFKFKTSIMFGGLLRLGLAFAAPSIFKPHVNLILRSGEGKSGKAPTQEADSKPVRKAKEIQPYGSLMNR